MNQEVLDWNKRMNGNKNLIMKPKVLIVEDDKALVDIVTYNLRKEGFQVFQSFVGEGALSLVKTLNIDIVLLDWALPGISGLEVCNDLRSNPETANVPIIMISNKNQDLDKVSGLERGADDYMSKPLSAPELIARIRAVLKRLRPIFFAKTITYRDVVMDLTGYTVTRQSGSDKAWVVQLSPTEFNILRALIESPNRVLSREALIAKIWGHDSETELRTVDVHMTRLRKVLLAASPDGFDIICTVRSAGYKLAI